ncbi:MAG: helix-turn-helix domain-containing protein [Pseudomonadota bacterium]
MPQLEPTSRSDASTRDAIKVAARTLFTERGVDAVSVRDIVAAAGQRNGGAVHYHFGSIDNLLRELVVDGARPLDQRRSKRLDVLEKSGGPTLVREVVAVLVEPIVEGGADEHNYIRFLSMMQFGHHRTLFLEALGGRWNTGWQRALKHLKHLLPDLPLAVLKQRMIFLELFIGTAVAQREHAIANTLTFDRPWRPGYTMDNLIDSLSGMLQAPASAETLARVERS